MKYREKDFRYYFANSKPDPDYWRVMQGQDILVSLAYIKGDKMIELAKNHRGNIMLDSGAFTNFTKPGTVKFEDWMEFVQKNISWIDEYVQFDDLRSRNRTIKYYYESKQAGLNPLFVDHLHFSTRPTALDKLWVDCDKLCVAGFAKRQPGSETTGRKFDFSETATPLADQHNTQMHLLAVGSLKRFLPFMKKIHSVDSSKWGTAASYGHFVVMTKRENADGISYPAMTEYNTPYARSQERRAPGGVLQKSYYNVIKANNWGKHSNDKQAMLVSIYWIKKYIEAIKKEDWTKFEKTDVSKFENESSGPGEIPDVDPLDETSKDVGWQPYIKKRDPYIEYPPEDKGPYPYTIQHHFRGCSLHADLRIGFKPKQTLIGWTLNTQKPGAVKEPVTSLAQAKAFAKRMDEISKVNWSTGKWEGNIMSQPKTTAPWAWLDVEGRTKDPEPGKAPPVGGTRNFPGVFHILEKGDIEYLTQKPLYHEYLVHSPAGAYRLVFRKIQGQSKADKDFKDGSHVCLVLKVPDAVAKKFPTSSDTDEPHVTVMYIGNIPKEKVGSLMATVDAVTAGMSPFSVKLASDVTYFEPTENSDGKRVAKMQVESDGVLEKLHSDLKSALKKDDIELGHSFKYSAHATLAYIEPGTEYSGDIPKGEWKVDKVEVWGFDQHFGLPLDVQVLKAVEPPSEDDDAYGTGWIALRAADLMPYVLDEDTVASGWMPPTGVSALPKVIRDKVPEGLRYWDSSSPAEARKLRDALVKAINDKTVDIDPEASYAALSKQTDTASMADARFVLQSQRWKSDEGSQGSETWWLRLNTGRKKLSVLEMCKDPRTQKSFKVKMLEEQNKANMGFEGNVSAGHYLNCSRGMPSTMKVLDKGKASIVAMTDDLLQVALRGEKVKGLFTAEKKDGEWQWSGGQEVTKSEEGLQTIVCPIIKADSEKRLVTGIVLEPDTIDAHNDFEKKDTILKAAHTWLSEFNNETHLGLMHNKFGDIGLELAESWIAPIDMRLNGQDIKEGTWLMTVKVISDATWKKVKSGEYTGFSIGGVATVS